MRQPAKPTGSPSSRMSAKRDGRPSGQAGVPRCARKPQQSINPLRLFHPLESDCLLVSLSPPQSNGPVPSPFPSEASGQALGEPSSLKEIEPCPYDADNDSFKLSYDIVGGFSRNAVRVFWEAEDEDHSPRWIGLQTFTGMQLKWVSSHKNSSEVFALAGEDAYSYCDKDPCETCPFRCKRGFTVFVLLENERLIALPLHQEPF